jgi:hypothetical protein
MFSFDQKPGPSSALSPASRPAPQRRAKAPPVNPLWSPLARSSDLEAAASPETIEKRRRYLFDPSSAAAYGVAAVPPEQRRMIRHGSAGIEVEYAQDRLNAHGASPPLAVDGIFGPATRAATIEYQSSHALVPDAIIGPKSWASLDGPTQVGKPESAGSSSSGGGGGPGATTLLYDTDLAPVTPPAPGTKKADVQKQVEAKQQAGDLGPTVKAADGGDDALGAHLLNVAASLGTKARWASENDLVTVIGYPPKADAERPVGKVTLRIDGSGNAECKLVSAGKVTTAAKFADLDAAKAGIKADFGFKDVKDGTADWKPDELNKVYAALSRLSAGEKSALVGVELVRELTIIDDQGRSLDGQFTFKHQVTAGETTAVHEEVLRIATSAFSADGLKFIGGATDAAEASFQTILHEAGHAVERAEERKALAASADARATDNAALNTLNQADTAQSTAMAAARESFIALDPKTQRPAVPFANASFTVTNRWPAVTGNRDVTKYDDLIKAAKAATARRETARAALEKASPSHVALTQFKDPNQKVDAWGQAAEARAAAHKKRVAAENDAASKVQAVPGGQPGANESKRLGKFRAFVAKEKLTPPTTYAKTDGMAEWYAEAFSLWKSDPEFLGDQYPKLKKWFDDGEHLKD